MKYVIDHDLHIHSHLSLCSGVPEQTTENILKYAQKNNLKHICVTDHYWDENVPGASKWYAVQNYERIAQSLPLPQAEGVTFHFGCETDMDKFLTVGVARKTMDLFDFIIIPTTHLHMTGFTIDESELSTQGRANAWVKRLNKLLEMDIPAHKIGIAHLNCDLIDHTSWEAHMDVLDAIPDATYEQLFRGVAQKGFGVELNMLFERYTDEEKKREMRPFIIAKECGCKFYLGGDAHSPADFDRAPAVFRGMLDYLDLDESHKFNPFA